MITKLENVSVSCTWSWHQILSWLRRPRGWSCRPGCTSSLSPSRTCTNTFSYLLSTQYLISTIVHTVGAIFFENHIINHDFLSVFKLGLPTSTSIFSAISASIFKISVPIIKRRSSGFRNTPRSHLSDEYWPRKQQKTKWRPKLNIKNILGKLYLL